MLRGAKLSKYLYCSPFIFIFSLIFSTFLSNYPLLCQTSKESMLKKVFNNPRLVSEVFFDDLGDEILKITDTSINYSRYKIISNYKNNNKNSFPGFDTTSYNVYDLDSSVYSGIYEEWIWTGITGRATRPFKVGDINNDGIPEFYGRRYDTRTNPITDYWGIAEYDPSNEKIIEKHTWIPSVFDLFVYNGPIYDIDKDGNDEVYMIGVSLYDTLLYFYGRSYKENPETGLATDINFDFRDWGQMNDTEFGDFDGDNLTDIVYFMNGPSTIKIGKFNPGIVNFDSTFWYRTYPEAAFAAGFSTGDVDNDGYADIVLATSRGIIWVYEYQPDIENYVRIFEADAGIFNTYTHFNTNDIDGNGKIEFWVGGDAFFNGEAITRYFCFESDDNNSYKPVHMIELRGIFSTNAYNAFEVDIDKDGKSEIGFCHDQTFYIFKFTGLNRTPNTNSFIF